MIDFKPARILPPHLLKNAKILANREALIPLLPTDISFCEVGVALGDYSERVMRGAAIKKFLAVDLFTLHDYPTMWGGRIGIALGGRRHADYFRERFASDLAAGRLEMLEGASTVMLATLPDSSVDVFYVDASHSYDAVIAELKVIKNKIRPHGWIILNDYIMQDYLTNTPYGVVQAANDFMIEEGWEMIYFCLHTGMYCDVVIRKVCDE